MPRIPFHQLPDEARLWVFPANRRLGASEEEALLDQVEEFLSSWAAHGDPLEAGMDWREGRFLLVAVDEGAAHPSGCSIDALVNRLKELGGQDDLTLVDHSPVWYRAEDGIRCLSRPEFKRLVEEGRVDHSTPVFDTSITRMAQLRQGEWERPAGTSWHRRAFFL
jgi:hypothetical protein